MFEINDFPSTDVEVIVLCVITIILFWVVYTPISIYFLYQFNLHRNKQTLKKRYCIITIIECIIIILVFIFNGFTPVADILRDERGLIIRQTTFYFAIFLEHCVIWCWIWRFWMIFYDIRWMLACQQSQWQSIIDTNGKQNWFIINKSRYGNKSYVFKILFIVCILCGFIGTLLRFIFDGEGGFRDEIGEATNYVFQLIGYIILLFITFKIPKFDDHIYVRVELKLLSMILSVMMITIIIITIIEQILKINDDHYDDSQIVLFLIIYNIVNLCNFLCLLVSTWFVLNKLSVLLVDKNDKFASNKNSYVLMNNNDNSIDTEVYTDMKNFMDNAQNIVFEHNTLNGTLTLNKDLYENIKLSSVIQNGKSFDLFMIHLSMEFSMECLLSFVEFVQFKQHMYNHITINNTYTISESEKDKYIGFDQDLDIKFPDNVPKSSIVYSEDNGTINFNQNNRIIAKKLYAKYIEIKSEFEINIPHKMRQKLKAFFDNSRYMTNNSITDMELMNIFNTCNIELKYLLHDAFTRFKFTPQFKQLSQLLFVS